MTCSHLCLELGVEGVRAAAQELPDGGASFHAVLRRVVAVLALARVGADQLPREALAIPVIAAVRGKNRARGRRTVDKNDERTCGHASKHGREREEIIAINSIRVWGVESTGSSGDRGNAQARQGVGNKKQDQPEPDKPNPAGREQL